MDDPGSFAGRLSSPMPLRGPDPKNRIFGSAAIASRCVIAGVNFLRVHDIKEICQVIKMTKSII